MATILVIEDGATVSREVTRLLEAAGHRVVRCGGGPTPLAACLLLRYGRCPFVDTTPISSCSPPHWLCPYPAAPTAASTCCAPTAPTPTTGGFPLCSWPSRPRTTWGERGRSRWWRHTRTRLPWLPP